MVEGLLGFGGWDHPDLTVESAVIEPIDVRGDRLFEIVDRLPPILVPD
jgi:hypothetical protein